jgi:hypothetical protein
MSTGTIYPINSNSEEPREPGESARARAAFCIYRDLGPERSVAAAWNAHQVTNGLKRSPIDGVKHGVKHKSKTPGRWNLWSSKYRWVERASAHDRRIDEAKCAALREEDIQFEKNRAAFRNEDQQQKIIHVREMNDMLHKRATAPYTDVTQEKEVTEDGKKIVNRVHVKGVKGSGYDAVMKQRNATAQLILDGGRDNETSDLKDICYRGEDAT